MVVEYEDGGALVRKITAAMDNINGRALANIQGSLRAYVLTPEVCVVGGRGCMPRNPRVRGLSGIVVCTLSHGSNTLTLRPYILSSSFGMGLLREWDIVGELLDVLETSTTCKEVGEKTSRNDATCIFSRAESPKLSVRTLHSSRS